MIGVREHLEKETLNELLDKHETWVYANTDDAEQTKKTAGGEQLCLESKVIIGNDMQSRELRSSEFVHCDMSVSDIRNSHLDRAFIIDCQLENVVLSGADMSHSEVINSNLKNSFLRGTDLHSAVLSNVNLSNSKLENADFRNTSLRDVDFTKASLDGADFRGAELNNVTFDRKNIHEALMDESIRAEILKSMPKEEKTSEEIIHGTTLQDFEGTVTQYLESIGISGITYIEPVEDYLEKLGSSGYEFFDGMELEPYIRNYSDYEDDGAYDSIREQYRNDAYNIYSEFEERYQLMAGITQTIGENGRPEYTAQVIPVFRDTETEGFKSIYDVAEEMSDRLPAEIEATTVINEHFSWEDGWEYNETDIAYDVSDVDIDMAMEKAYDNMKKLTDSIICEAEKNKSVEQSANSKQAKPKNKGSFER